MYNLYTNDTNACVGITMMNILLEEEKRSVCLCDKNVFITHIAKYIKDKTAIKNIYTNNNPVIFHLKDVLTDDNVKMSFIIVNDMMAGKTIEKMFQLARHFNYKAVGWLLYYNDDVLEEVLTDTDKRVYRDFDIVVFEIVNSNYIRNIWTKIFELNNETNKCVIL